MHRAGRREATALGLVAACAVAFALRAIGWEGVFLGDQVLLSIGDGHYHARLALYTLVNWPEMLVFDGYLNYPDGSSLPAVPVLAFAVSTIARVLGGDVSTLERVLAWWSPVTGALTPLPVYLAARCAADRGPALGAAFLVAVLPVLATASHVGNSDHTSVQVLLGATLLWLALALVSPVVATERSLSRLAAFALGLALVRAAIVLLWSGSLLYVLLADGLVLVAAALAARGDVLGAELASLGLAAALLAPVVLSLPEPPGGAYSAVSLSRLHLWALAAGGGVAGAALAALRARPRSGPLARLLWLAAAGAAVAAAVLAFPGPREGLLLALRFVAEGSDQGDAIFELMPLLPLFGAPVGQPPENYYGAFAWAVPLAPLGALLAARDPARRVAALVLAGWTAVLAPLAVWQARYGCDFAPAGAIGFALLLAAATRPLARLAPAAPRALRPAVAVAAACALLSVPALHYAPGLARSAAALAGERPSPEIALASPGGSLVRFLRSVREATPETSGFLGPGRPEYGILCRPRIGHPLHYVARRAAPADGFLHTLGPANFADVLRFFRTHSEAEAAAIAERLRVRYVLTMFFPGVEPGSIEDRLHEQAGAGDAAGAGRLERFRLMTEGPPDGAPLSDLFDLPRPPDVVPYRLFEVVAGAVLAVRAPPDAPVSARVWLVTPLAHRIAYEARGVAGPDGIARLRVPYATDRTGPTIAHGPYQVRAGEAVAEVMVSDTAVREGREIDVVPAAPAAAQNASKSSASKRTRLGSTLRPLPLRSPNIRISGTGRTRRGRSR